MLVIIFLCFLLSSSHSLELSGDKNAHRELKLYSFHKIMQITSDSSMQRSVIFFFPIKPHVNGSYREM